MSEEQPQFVNVDFKIKAKENDTEEKYREVDVGQQKLVSVCSKVKVGEALILMITWLL